MSNVHPVGADIQMDGLYFLHLIRPLFYAFLYCGVQFETGDLEAWLYPYNL